MRRVASFRFWSKLPGTASSPVLLSGQIWHRGGRRDRLAGEDGARLHFGVLILMRCGPPGGPLTVNAGHADPGEVRCRADLAPLPVIVSRLPNAGMEAN
jgi:hypothetical protein